MPSALIWCQACYHHPYFLVHLSAVDIDAVDPEDNISASVNTCQKTNLSPRRISEHRRCRSVCIREEKVKNALGCSGEAQPRSVECPVHHPTL